MNYIFKYAVIESNMITAATNIIFSNELEHSILERGFLDPVLLINDGNGLYCDTEGHKRIAIAKKHNLFIPAIVKDFINNFEGFELNSEKDIEKFFNSLPNISKAPIQPSKPKKPIPKIVKAKIR